MLKEEIYDIEKQLPIAHHRESEGQDTITSLNNNDFIKKLDKLKRQESNRSNLSMGSQQSLSKDSVKKSKGTNFDSFQNNVSSKPPSRTSSIKNMPSSLRSLFKAKEIDESSKSLNESLSLMEDYLVSKQQQQQKQTESNNCQVLEYQRQISEPNKSVTSKPFTLTRQQTVNSSESTTNGSLPFYSRSESKNNTNKRELSPTVQHLLSKNKNHNSKTDQVYDALSIILKNSITNDNNLETEFVNKIKKHIAETKSLRERKSNKVKWMCSIAVYLFFFIMFLMVCYFIKTLYVIITNLNNNLTYNYKSSFVYKILPINGTSNVAAYFTDQLAKLVYSDDPSSNSTVSSSLFESNVTLNQQSDFFS